MLRRQNPRYSVGKIIVASMLAALPLIECVSSVSAFAKGEPETPNAKPGLTTVNGNFRCRLIPQEGVISFDSKDGASHLRVKLDIPKGVDLSDLILFSCSESITVIATPRYLVRTMGYGDAELGKLMIGMLGGIEYPQNMLVWDMKPLGRIIRADVFEPVGIFHGNEAAVQSGPGKFYRIDLDNPTSPVEEL